MLFSSFRSADFGNNFNQTLGNLNRTYSLLCSIKEGKRLILLLYIGVMDFPIFGKIVHFQICFNVLLWINLSWNHCLALSRLPYLQCKNIKHIFTGFTVLNSFPLWILYVCSVYLSINNGWHCVIIGNLLLCFWPDVWHSNSWFFILPINPLKRWEVKPVPKTPRNW